MKDEKRRMSILTLRLCYLLEARTQDNPRNVTTTARIILVLAMFKNENTRIFVSGKQTVNRLLVSCINFFHRENSSTCVVCCIFSFKLHANTLDADQTASISRMRRVHPFLQI